MADWTELLEDREVDVHREEGRRRYNQAVDVEAPAGFGRSEYDRMVEELWSDGDYQSRSPVDRTLSFASVSGDLIREMGDVMLTGRAENVKDYGIATGGAVLGAAGVAATPLVQIGGQISDAIFNRMDAGSYTTADVLYDTSRSVRQKRGKLFYTEKPETSQAPGQRRIRIIPDSGSDIDRKIIEDTLSYLENFEA